MSVWTSVKAWTAVVVSVADLQTYISDNTQYLYDLVTTSSRMLDRQVSLQTVVNTTTETAVYTYAVPGGTLSTNKTIHLSLIGDMLSNSSSSSWTIRAKYGATTIFEAADTSVNVSATRNGFVLDLELTAANATNAQRSKGIYYFSGIGDGVSGVAVSLSWAGGGGGLNKLNAGGMFQQAIHTSIAEDSTASKNLVITFQMSVANALHDMRAHTVYTEVK